MTEHVDYTDSFIAETYDYVVPYRNRNDLQFYLDIARRFQGPILELGCGTGRILLPTARESFPITGLDHSNAMLSICEEKLMQEPEDVRKNVNFVKGDLREFQINQQFNLVTIPFRTFHHLFSTEDQLACLECIHRHLEPEGGLILDLFNPYLPYLYDKRFRSIQEKEPPFSMPDGRHIVRSSRLLNCDLFEQILDMVFVYTITHPDQSEDEKQHRFSMRYFFRYEVEHMLGRCGFNVYELYSEYDMSPYGAKYPGEMIFVAKKV